MSGSKGEGPQRERQASYREVFAEPEFRAVWGAQVLSLVGDWLAQVALAILVFERTGSALLAALTYALIFLPQFVGGPLLSGLADFYPRRAVMLICDVARVGLVALMAIPRMPFWSLLVLLFTTHLLLAPFAAARAAILPDILRGDRYVLGLSISNITYQTSQVVGFLVGGAVVAAVGSRSALLIDAGTFLLSAVLLWYGVRARPAPVVAASESSAASGSRRFTPVGSLTAGARIVFGDPRMRPIVVMAWLCAFYVVPEGLATPYAQQFGGADLTVGMIMAAMPVGAVVGMVVISRFLLPDRRLQMMGPLAVLTCVPLVVTAFLPGLASALLMLVVVGFASAYNLPANAAFVKIVPEAGRAQAFGLVQGGLYAFQGLAIMIAGVAAEVLQPEIVIAISGALGLALALWAAVAWSRAPALTASVAEARSRVGQ